MKRLNDFKKRVKKHKREIEVALSNLNKWLKKHNKGIEIALLIILILMTLFIGSLWGMMIKDTLELLTKFFGKETMGIIIAYTILAIMTSAIYLLIMKIASEMLSQEKKFNFCFHLTICAVVSFFCIGIISISLFTNIQDLSSILKDKNNKDLPAGELKCYQSSGGILEGGMVKCNVTKPTLAQFNSTVTLIDRYNNFTPIVGSDIIEFEAKGGTTYVYFEIEGATPEGNHVSLHVGRNIEVVSQEELDDKKDRRLAYVVGLIVLILFSVPSAILNLRELYREKK